MRAFWPVIDTSRFFDWASTAPLSAAAVGAMNEFSRQQENARCPPDFLTWATAQVDGLRQTLAQCLHTGPHQQIVLYRSVAEAVSVLAAGLTMPPGSSVVVTEADHESAVLPWAYRPEVTVRTARCAPCGLLDLEDAERLIDASTVVVSVSQVSHLDGVVQPVRELAAITRERSGALLVVDGAQAVGRIPVDLTGLGADIYLGAGRKALLSPLGTAFLAAAPEVLARIRPGLLSTRAAELARDTDGHWQARPRLRDLVRRFEGNLPDLRCLAGLRASVQAYLDANPAHLAQRTVELTRTLLDAAPGTGLSPAQPVAATPAGILRVRAPGTDHLRLKQVLRPHGFSLAATTDWLRISLLSFNNEAGVHELLRRIQEAL
jgi:cysteine desulfurase / selenocysteine lyase